MAEQMNLEVTAEGVETLEQLKFLRAGRCTDVQGYRISRPMPVQEAERFFNMHALEGWKAA